MSAFPYDLNNLLGGRHRLLYAPMTVAVPTDISDIISMVSPYTAATGWEDFGATGGAFTYGRNITKAGYNIQQASVTVLEEVTEVVRTFSIAAAEFTSENMAIFEESTGADAVAAGVNTGAQTRVPYGNVSSITPYRVAVLAQRKKAQGVVTEPGGATRGAWVGWVGYKCELSADNSQISLGEGDMATAPIGFTLYPESTISTEGEEHGFFIAETAPATISAS